MRRTAPTCLALGLLAAALVPSCAIVDSVSAGLTAVGRYANGIVRGKGEVVDGRQQGDWEYLSEGGRVRARGRYEDDEQVGLWTYYYESGQKEYEGVLENERRVGRYQYWHANGNPRAVGSFVDGREFGEWTFWNPRGGLAQRGPFLDGLRSGRWSSFHASGTLATEGLYLEGQQVGTWRIVSPDGEQTLAWTPLTERTEWIADTWDDGAPRREGFRVLGRPSGLWTLYHESGDPRLVGTFENGVPHGHWVVFGEARERIGEGRVELGRPVGTWKVRVAGAMADVDASGFAPSMPFAGEWSSDDLARRDGVEGALAIWLSEIAAPVDADAVADMSEPEDTASEEALAAADVEPDVPVMAQPWTVFELDNFETLVEAYRRGGEAVKKLRSRYARVRGGGAAKGPAIPEPGGDVDTAQGFVGRPLALTTYRNTSGEEFDLASLRGEKVVLVVLRGYGGKVCVYCTAQTSALCDENAFEEFERLGARLQIVFPGSRNGLSTFLDAFASLSDAEIPPYGMLYQDDFTLGKELDLEGDKVIPTTFILDEEGIVRFAYVGKTAADRPSVELLVEELEKLKSRP